MNRWDRITVYMAYILLVGVVASGAWYLTALAEQASEDRCREANLMSNLLVFDLASADVDAVGADLMAEIMELADERVELICEGTGIEPARFEDE